jgi:hypothetical protein
MQPEPVTMHHKLPYARVPPPARERPLRRAGAWPFPETGRRICPEIGYAALKVLRTTARDWGLAASR